MKRRLLSILLALSLLLTLAPAALAEGEETEETAGVITLSKDGTAVGETFDTIQAAVDYITEQANGDGVSWLVTVPAGTYGRFLVPHGVKNITIQGAGEQTVVTTLDGSALSVTDEEKHGSDGQGIIIWGANITLKDMKITSGAKTNGVWYASAVGTQDGMWGSGSEVGTPVILDNCILEGSGTGIAFMPERSTFRMKNCRVSNYAQAIYFACDNYAADDCVITGNTITDCVFAVHGYYGGGKALKNMTISGNAISGSSGRFSVIAVLDQSNTGAVGLDIQGNTFSYTIVGGINVREETDMAAVMKNNTMTNHSFVADAYWYAPNDYGTTFYAPKQEGKIAVWYASPISEAGNDIEAIKAALDDYGTAGQIIEINAPAQELFTMAKNAIVIQDYMDAGDLTVTKTVNGGNEDETFDFVIQLTREDGRPLNGSYDCVNPDGTESTIQLENLADRQIRISLGDGESFTIKDLLPGTKYTVTEELHENYWSTCDGRTSGEITADKNVVEFTNTYRTDLGAKEGALVISKTVNGGDLNKEFTFSVALSAEGTYTYTGSKTGSIANGGTVTLKNGESISINNLPEGTSYTVTEAAVEGYTAAVSGHDASQPYYGSTAEGMILSGSAAVVHYTNTYSPVKPDDPYIPPVRPVDPVIPDEPDKPALRQDHIAYIIGYPEDYVTGKPTDDTTRWPVKPQGNITRAEVTTIFFRLLTDESRAYFWSQTNGYTDVKFTAWYNNAVSTMTNAGIVTGYPDGSFRPDAPITRAEFAAIAARFSEVVYNGGNTFTDVPENHWAARFIALAEHLGWIEGYPDGSFRPDQAITRAEAMTLINRVLERAVETEHMLPDMVRWADNPAGAWYYEAVQEATNSHEYVRLSKQVPGQDFCYEDWLTILPVPDWEALEKTWSTAYSK